MKKLITPLLISKLVLFISAAGLFQSVMAQQGWEPPPIYGPHSQSSESIHHTLPTASPSQLNSMQRDLPMSEPTDPKQWKTQAVTAEQKYVAAKLEAKAGYQYLLEKCRPMAGLAKKNCLKEAQNNYKHDLDEINNEFGKVSVEPTHSKTKRKAKSSKSHHSKTKIQSHNHS